ncbi:MAG: hypothetical protein VX527_11220 [Planctomycetota bacterium]|nr:hypothetical protein [Planctomycetota bacterium]
MTQAKPTGYWTGVLGTSMFFMGVLGLAFGWTTVSIGNELHALAITLHDHRFGIALGGIVHSLTVGVMNLSGVETADTAKKLLAVMPTPYFLQIMGFIRMGISIAAIVIGVFMVLRKAWTVPAAALWALLSIVWFFLATWKAWEVLKESIGHPLKGGNTPIFATDAFFHLVWPVFLACWLVPAWYKGKAKAWKKTELL